MALSNVDFYMIICHPNDLNIHCFWVEVEKRKERKKERRRKETLIDLNEFKNKQVLWEGFPFVYVRVSFA